MPQTKADCSKIERPWICGGCGVEVSLEESLCPSCTAQLFEGGLGWTDGPEQDGTGEVEIAIDPGDDGGDCSVVFCSQCRKSRKIPKGEFPPLVGWCGCDNNARVGA